MAGRRGRGEPQDVVDPVAHAMAKLRNADQARPDGAKRSLSGKGKAAIAALDPVRKPIKAGAS